MKLNNSNFDETQKLKLWWNLKTQIVMKLKNSNLKTQIVTKLELWQISLIKRKEKVNCFLVRTF